MAGNHEHAVADRLDLGWFNRYARAAAEWTRERLDTAHRDWLGALPLVREIGDATLVHASPAQPDEWDYLVTAEDGFAAFSHFATRWCFVGHSHVPGVWSLGSSGPDHERGAAAVRQRAGSALHRQRGQRRSAARPGSRARPGRCGTWRPGGSICVVSSTTSTPPGGRSSRPGCRSSWPIGWRRAPEPGARQPGPCRAARGQRLDARAGVPRHRLGTGRRGSR